MEKSKKKIFQERLLNLYKFRDLFTQLVQRDIKLKYRRSFLGYVWSVLNPLLIMVVQAIVFSLMFKRNIEHYPAYLITGNVLFQFMKESSNHSLASVTSNASLLKKTYVPKYIFALSKVTSDLVNMFFAFGALVLVLIFTGVPFTWYALLLFIPVVELYIFCIGLGIFLAQAAVFFRDIRYIWGVVTTAWMYLTPLFYDVSFLPNSLRWIVERFNPMFYYVTQFRDFVMYGQMPWSPLIWRGALVAVIMLLVGIWSFLRSKDKLILHI